MFTHFFQTLRIGIFSLLLHKLRSSLAVLGILIGTTAVIWLVAMGEGVSYNIIILSVKPAQQSSTAGSSFFLEYGVTRADFERVVTNLPSVIDRAVKMRVMPREVWSFDRSLEVRIVGCTPEYFELNHLNMFRGRFLNEVDNNPPNNVCVLAATTAQKLFPLQNPIGQSVKIDNDFYEVVGQTGHRDPSAAIGGSLASQDYNLDIYIPLETLRVRIGDMILTSRSGSREGEIVQLSQITVSISNLDDVNEAADIIRTLMDKYHVNQDVAIVVPKELLRKAESLRMIFNVLLVVIAGISLLVGGIGIMNIMLATVTERTREIGIRRALGARRHDIVQQFLVEAVVLTGLGGSLGVALGFLCVPGIEAVRTLALQMFPEQMEAVPKDILDLQPRIANWSIVVSFGISVVTGMIFGMYPAFRAANMDPIEALRHE
jgi:putative ABC transport system permease protein